MPLDQSSLTQMEAELFLNIVGQGQSKHWLRTYHGKFFWFLLFYYRSY